MFSFITPVSTTLFLPSIRIISRCFILLFTYFPHYSFYCGCTCCIFWICLQLPWRSVWPINVHLQSRTRCCLRSIPTWTMLWLYHEFLTVRNGFWRLMQGIKQERISAAIRLWFFYTHMSLCTLCPWTMLCYRNHCVPWHGQHNLTSLPAAIAIVPLTKSLFLMHLRSALFLVTAHRGRHNHLNCPAELQEGETIYFLLLSD